MKLEAVPYEGHRKRYFEDLLAKKHRQLDYWSKLDGFFRPEDIGMEISYIEDAIKALESIDTIKAERDAAIKDMNDFINHGVSMCRICKRRETCLDDFDCKCNWEWRGVLNE